MSKFQWVVNVALKTLPLKKIKDWHSCANQSLVPTCQRRPGSLCSTAAVAWPAVAGCAADTRRLSRRRWSL